MSRTRSCWKQCKKVSRFIASPLSVTGWIALSPILSSLTIVVDAARAQGDYRTQLVPILGVTKGGEPDRYGGLYHLVV
jgi:hypothetical protein